MSEHKPKAVYVVGEDGTEVEVKKAIMVGEDEDGDNFTAYVNVSSADIFEMIPDLVHISLMKTSEQAFTYGRKAAKGTPFGAGMGMKQPPEEVRNALDELLKHLNNHMGNGKKPKGFS
jgi:hypothetical protein